MLFILILLIACLYQQEQLESAQREIAMGNERERQLQGKLLKAKEEIKLEREEVNKGNFMLSDIFATCFIVHYVLKMCSISKLLKLYLLNLLQVKSFCI